MTTRFPELAQHHFHFLEDMYGFSAPNHERGHANESLEYHGQYLNVTIDYERFNQIAIWIGFPKNKHSVGWLDYLKATGAASEELLKPICTSEPQYLDEKLNLAASQFAEHGIPFLQGDKQALQVVRQLVKLEKKRWRSM